MLSHILLLSSAFTATHVMSSDVDCSTTNCQNQKKQCPDSGDCEPRCGSSNCENTEFIATAGGSMFAEEHGHYAHSTWSASEASLLHMDCSQDCSFVTVYPPKENCFWLLCNGKNSCNGLIVDDRNRVIDTGIITLSCGDEPSCSNMMVECKARKCVVETSLGAMQYTEIDATKAGRLTMKLGAGTRNLKSTRVYCPNAESAKCMIKVRTTDIIGEESALYVYFTCHADFIIDCKTVSNSEVSLKISTDYDAVWNVASTEWTLVNNACDDTIFAEVVEALCATPTTSPTELPTTTSPTNLPTGTPSTGFPTGFPTRSLITETPTGNPVTASPTILPAEMASTARPTTAASSTEMSTSASPTKSSSSSSPLMSPAIKPPQIEISAHMELSVEAVSDFKGLDCATARSTVEEIGNKIVSGADTNVAVSACSLVSDGINRCQCNEHGSTQDIPEQRRLLSVDILTTTFQVVLINGSDLQVVTTLRTKLEEIQQSPPSLVLIINGNSYDTVVTIDVNVVEVSLPDSVSPSKSPSNVAEQGDDETEVRDPIVPPQDGESKSNEKWMYIGIGAAIFVLCAGCIICGLCGYFRCSGGNKENTRSSRRASAAPVDLDALGGLSNRDLQDYGKSYHSKRRSTRRHIPRHTSN